MAVWGNPATMADAAFECRAGGSIVFWLGSEAPLSGGRPMQFWASGATALLDEQFVEDGVGTSEFLIQRGSALHVAIAAGKGRLKWRLPDGQQGAIRLAPAVQQLFAACAPG
ncbi:hypothetical protein [Sandarakinorhabdus rubra]|uniref:hypothetical protein n=1 Tax=Sandarakinorhabdus rubra TaxID=2672568 RepID=UPI0013DA6C6E|nr:hypothetical protein [Sandarakinorhabdus rubra]